MSKLAERIVVKSADSPARLLDDTALFLHRVIGSLPEAKRKMVEKLYSDDESLAGRKILVVDDDVRNIFAMTSLLEQHDVTVLRAENGRDALRVLEEDATVDAVLMDIMMPGMDGYETTRAIRAMTAYKRLPIIALTAKAMRGDREKTIAAGCSDYLAKPVSESQLLALLRVWLQR